jgi:hypothetical protein
MNSNLKWRPAKAHQKVQVERNAESRPAKCVENVANHIARNGGTLVTGWQVVRSDLFTLYLHRAVWGSPSGELLDVTPTIHEDGICWEESIDFLRDDEAAFERDSEGEPCYRPAKVVPLFQDQVLERACGFLSRAAECYARGHSANVRYWIGKAEKEADRYLRRRNINRNIHFSIVD